MGVERNFFSAAIDLFELCNAILYERLLDNSSFENGLNANDRIRDNNRKCLKNEQTKRFLICNFLLSLVYHSRQIL